VARPRSPSSTGEDVTLASSRPPSPRATYQDVLEAPPHQVAELIDGDLYLNPRPALLHATASSTLGGLLMGPLQFGRGGPGGWRFLDEPELHFGEDVLVPDLAGWRVEHLAPGAFSGPWTALPPDWLCEVTSPSIAKLDLVKKRPLYHAAGIPWLWTVDPRMQSIELLERAAEGWTLRASFVGDGEAALAPFHDLVLPYGLLWSTP
jgi:Uma2 family endonuclease